MAAKKTKSTTKKKKTPAKNKVKKKTTGARTSVKRSVTKKAVGKAPIYALVVMAVAAGTFVLLNKYIKTADKRKTASITEQKIPGNAGEQKNAAQPDKPGLKTQDKTTNPAGNTQEKPARANDERFIYLISYDEKSEKISLAPVKRKIDASSPLTNILDELIKGPNAAERNRGLLTAVPENLRIRDIRINGRNAVVDFNSVIEENANGEILLNRVDQLVYTITQFEGIDGVVIKVNGRQKEYLGGEGLSVSKPIGRKDR